MAEVLAWVIERRVVLADRAVRLRKELAEIEAEVARLEAAEVVIGQFIEAERTGTADDPAMDAELERVTTAPGAGGMLLVPHRVADMEEHVLPDDYRRIMTIVGGMPEAATAKDVAVGLGRGTQPAQVEPVRGQLKRLAERGWLHRTPAGRYTSAPTRTA
ncbi:hypothetical protein [Streptacidiphilus neutrinimicus]|uniref:hypothetical protein n=1 Tax=Streptacidiphilus neutrinimicus TaxID=105420 RepID=UPI0005A8A0D6|nr:hypothetical protein [Streptacidiphilus neutrinimicus]